MPPRTVEDDSVFLNVPFDRSYEPRFVTLVAAIVCLGLRPRTVLELPELGQGRIKRIQAHLERCRFSIHDLSKVGGPARFNMPFELGLAYNLARYQRHHGILVLERVKHRLQRTLSDLGAHDPLLYKGSARSLINCVLDGFYSKTASPDLHVIERVAGGLRKVATSWKADTGRDSVYNRAGFDILLLSGIELALEEGLLAES